MDFIVSASTDAGNVKTVNQDCMNVQLLETRGRQLAFAVVCDGMGGLQRGELAGASVLHGFRRWREERLPILLMSGFCDNDIRHDWNCIIGDCNEKLKDYGRRNGVSLGTTATVMLITQERYYVANVGDSRAYEIRGQIRQITKDQTLVAREIELGRLRPGQEETDPRRNVLLQCIGASKEVYADFYFGTPCTDTVYMMCSDGFRHKLSEEERLTWLKPGSMCSAEKMQWNERALIGLVKERGERDNITVVTIRTYG